MGIYKKPRPSNHIFGGDRILRAWYRGIKNAGLRKRAQGRAQDIPYHHITIISPWNLEDIYWMWQKPPRAKERARAKRKGSYPTKKKRNFRQPPYIYIYTWRLYILHVYSQLCIYIYIYYINLYFIKMDDWDRFGKTGYAWKNWCFLVSSCNHWILIVSPMKPWKTQHHLESTPGNYPRNNHVGMVKWPKGCWWPPTKDQHVTIWMTWAGVFWLISWL